MEDDQILTRHTASSGKVGYSEPVVIRGGPSQTTYLDVRPSYIKHNNSPDELSLKLSYWKQAGGKFRVGYPAEFTLTQAEAVKLRDTINDALAIAKQNEDGQYLVLRLGEQSFVANNAEAATLSRSLAAALADPKIMDALKDDLEGRVALGAIQASARIIELHQATEDLEAALESGASDEQFYQEWCEKHGWVFGNAYAVRDDVRTIAVGDQVDLLLKNTAHGLRDIIELKRPDMDVIKFDKDHKSYYWSRNVSIAVGQCHRYLDVLHDDARTGLRDNPQVVAYHPRAFIVIGRSVDWSGEEHRALHGLNARLHSIQVMTYDHLLAQAQQVLKLLSSDAGNEATQ